VAHVITLLAVLVGALVTYSVQVKLDEKRAARERERDEKADERARAREREATEAEFAIAKRLMLEELDSLALHHALLAVAGAYPLARAMEHMFPTQTWENEKRTLAAGLVDEDHWAGLARFMHTIPRKRALVGSSQPHAPIEPHLIEAFRDGALIARDLHGVLSGRPAPSVTERGEPTGAEQITVDPAARPS
jgi:hypothetical protein